MRTILSWERETRASRRREHGPYFSKISAGVLRRIKEKKNTGPEESLAMLLAWWRAYKDDAMERSKFGRLRSTVTLHEFGQR